MTINRRKFLSGTAGLAAGGLLAGTLGTRHALAQATASMFTPEDGPHCAFCAGCLS